MNTGKNARGIKLTATQIRILTNVKKGAMPLDGASGMSQHGGWDRSLRSLCMKKFVCWDSCKGYELTEAGKKALEK